VLFGCDSELGHAFNPQLFLTCRACGGRRLPNLTAALPNYNSCAPWVLTHAARGMPSSILYSLIAAPTLQHPLVPTTYMGSPGASHLSPGKRRRPLILGLRRLALNLRRQTLQLDAHILDTPGCRIVNFATGLFTDDRGRNMAAVRPAKWKRILALVILSVLLFGGHVGIGSDLVYAQDPGPAKKTISTHCLRFLNRSYSFRAIHESKNLRRNLRF
jgi:hypothetical protein